MDNRLQRLEAEEDASVEWKTWQVNCFGKRNVLSQVEESMSGTDKTNGTNYIYNHSLKKRKEKKVYLTEDGKSLTDALAD